MNHNPTRRRITAAGAALLASPLWVAPRGARAEIKSGDNPDGSAIWQKVRASFFENRPIVNVGDDVLVLDAPGRAEDAAVVPIAMRSRLPQTAAGIFQRQKKNQHAQAPRRAGKTGADDVKHERCEIKLAGAEDTHEPADHRTQNGSDDRRTGANPLHFV